MVDANPLDEKKTLITELQQELDSDDDFQDDEQSSVDANDDQNQGGDQQQYFHVGDAEPPKNYDDPYSSLPPKVDQRLEQIKVSQTTVTTVIVARCDLFSQIY